MTETVIPDHTGRRAAPAELIELNRHLTKLIANS